MLLWQSLGTKNRRSVKLWEGASQTHPYATMGI